MLLSCEKLCSLGPTQDFRMDELTFPLVCLLYHFYLVQGNLCDGLKIDVEFFTKIYFFKSPEPKNVVFEPMSVYSL